MDPVLVCEQCDQIWQHIETFAVKKTLLAIFIVYLPSICQNFVPTLEFFFVGQIFIVENGQILNKSSSRLVTLTARERETGLM